jgi:hypothetical protein
VFFEDAPAIWFNLAKRNGSETGAFKTETKSADA